MKKIFAVVACAAVLSACGGKKSANGIDGDLTFKVADLIKAPVTESFTLNDIVENVEFVKMHAIDGELLPSFSIRDISTDGNTVSLISTPGGSSYVVQGNQIYSVDVESGTTVKIGRSGKGPQEYTQPSGVSTCNGKTYILDTNNKVLVYDSEGKFVRSFTTESSSDDMLAIDDDRLFFIANPYEDLDLYADTMWGVWMGDAEGKLIKKTCPYPNENKQGEDVGMSARYSPVKTSDGFIFIPSTSNYMKSMIVDRDGNVTSNITFDMGQYLTFPGYLKKYNSVDFNSSEMAVVNIIGIADNGAILFYLMNGGNNCAGIILNGELHTKFKIDSDSSSLDYVTADGKTVTLAIEKMMGNKLYAIIDAYKLVDIVDGITEESDPVLVVATLKKNFK